MWLDNLTTQLEIVDSFEGNSVFRDENLTQHKDTIKRSHFKQIYALYLLQ